MKTININKKEFYEFLKETLELEQCNQVTLFNKDDLDSFDKINLLISLEELYKSEISIIELFECETMGDIYNLCVKNMVGDN